MRPDARVPLELGLGPLACWQAWSVCMQTSAGVENEKGAGLFVDGPRCCWALHELGLCVVAAVLGLSLQRLAPENEPLTCKKRRPQMGLNKR